MSDNVPLSLQTTPVQTPPQTPAQTPPQTPVPPPSRLIRSTAVNLQDVARKLSFED